MLPTDLALLRVLAVCGDLRVLADPKLECFRIEPNTNPSEVCRPVADLFFGTSDAFVPLSNETLAEILKARNALPKAELTDEDILAQFDLVKAEVVTVEKERDALDAKLADAEAHIAALDKSNGDLAAYAQQLEKDLAEARAKIPVVAPVPHEAPPLAEQAQVADAMAKPAATDATPPIGTSTV